MFKEQNETAAEVLLSVHFKGPGLGEGSCFGVCWSAPMNAIEGSMNLCDDFYCIDGLPIDKSPLFKGSLVQGAHTKANPDMGRYENRDPRMKGTLMLPGMEWNGKLFTNNLPASSTCCIRNGTLQKIQLMNMTVVLTSMLSVMQRYFCHLLKL